MGTLRPDAVHGGVAARRGVLKWDEVRADGAFAMVASAPSTPTIAPCALDDSESSAALRSARPRLFGQFLIDAGVLTRAELGEALTLMRALNSSIGELAVAHGLVTRAQADRIHALQRQVDGRWGEIAVALGIGGATAQRIERLAWEQDLANLRLSDAVVELGFASATEIDGLHAEFETVPVLATEAVDATVELVLEGLPRLVGRALGSPVRAGAPRLHDGTTLPHHVELVVVGPTPMRVGIAVDRPLSRAIAVALPDDDARSTQRAEAGLAALAGIVGDHVRRRLDGRALGHAIGSARTGTLPGSGTAIELALADGEALLVLAPM
jgi:hypothetical protein